ncbi:recombinase family protein [Streptobacillus moniliformis]|uniref:recombinase family protein n=1 Tax=Streptobacillus moniliformis TaxID=34105 RepID=UPI0018C8751A|nr:recombinase family protein [Streptobacillus moniliformis]
MTEEDKYKWTHRMVLSILRDPVYCGNRGRNKRPTLSLKNRKRLYVSKEKAIIKVI